MRVYFEKPRTTVGWKGLINDPYLDESCRISEGLRIARAAADRHRPAGRALGQRAARHHLAAVHRRPDRLGRDRRAHDREPGAPRARVGLARRRSASRTAPTATCKIACDAIQAASRPHHFLGVHKSGQIAMIRTRGNPDCHIILRGGTDAELRRGERGGGVRRARSAPGLPPSLMVDCSHANCGKQHERQLDVVRRDRAPGRRRAAAASSAR